MFILLVNTEKIFKLLLESNRENDTDPTYNSKNMSGAKGKSQKLNLSNLLGLGGMKFTYLNLMLSKGASEKSARHSMLRTCWIWAPPSTSGSTGLV